MMRAAEIMTRDVATVRPDTSVHGAVALLTKRGCTSLPVLDEDNRVVGIVSEVDLLRDRMPRDPRSHLRPEPHQQADPARLVRDVMNATVVCVSASADTADLAGLMIEQDVRAIPIIDGATLVGIVSRRDVLLTLVRDDKAIAAEVTTLLGQYAGTADRWNVEVDDGIVSVSGQFTTEEVRVVDLLARSVPGVLRVHCHRRWGPVNRLSRRTSTGGRSPGLESPPQLQG
jgi:CBS domain-containing protein